AELDIVDLLPAPWNMRRVDERLEIGLEEGVDQAVRREQLGEIVESDVGLAGANDRVAIVERPLAEWQHFRLPIVVDLRARAADRRGRRAARDAADHRGKRRR